MSHSRHRQPDGPRVAALYDVHGNPPTLEAVLDRVGVDRIVVGGDLLWGPFTR